MSTGMFFKKLGTTGLQIPEIGLGTWNYHGGTAPILAGLQAGARFIDTAESYGSEPLVAQAIVGQRERVFLATKISPEHFAPAEVFKSADESLRRLRTDHIDLYQLHEPNSKIPIAETMGAMEELVDSGKVRFIGVSNFSASELARARAAMRKHPIVANQVRYNLTDRTIEQELLGYCRRHGITVIAYSPLGRELQRVLDRDPQGLLRRTSQDLNRTIPQILLNWCLSKDDVVAIPKGNSVEHVLDNCGASGWRLPGAVMDALERGIQFRQRSRAEILLRRVVPASLGTLAQRCLNRLPKRVRRWVR